MAILIQKINSFVKLTLPEPLSSLGKYRFWNLMGLVAGIHISGDELRIVRGPYLQSVSSTQVVVKFNTNREARPVVEYGTEYEKPDKEAWDNLKTSKNAILIQNLTPATKYYYAVKVDDTLLLKPHKDLFFIASPEAGKAADSRIWLLGDAGTADYRAKRVLWGYMRYRNNRSADMMIMLGDNAYDTGTEEEYQRAVFSMYGSVLHNTPLWSTLGNHDAVSAIAATQAGPYFDIFTFPKNGEAGGVPSNTEAYFSHDYANIHFVNLNSNEITDPMVEWLKRDLASQHQDWLIAYFHHPPYSDGRVHSDDSPLLRAMREEILPLLEARGVDLVFSGHNHSYERSKFIFGHFGLSDEFKKQPYRFIAGGAHGDGGGGTGDRYFKFLGNNKGAVYVVAGSSGKTGYGYFEHPAMAVSLLELGSVDLHVRNNQCHVRFINHLGEVRDEFSIIKTLISVKPEKLTIFQRNGVFIHDSAEVMVCNPRNIGLENLDVYCDAKWLSVKLIHRSDTAYVLNYLKRNFLPKSFQSAEVRIGRDESVNTQYVVRFKKIQEENFFPDKGVFLNNLKMKVERNGNVWVINKSRLSYDLAIFSFDGRILFTKKNVAEEVFILEKGSFHSRITKLHIKCGPASLVKTLFLPGETGYRTKNLALH